MFTCKHIELIMQPPALLWFHMVSYRLIRFHTVSLGEHTYERTEYPAEQYGKVHLYQGVSGYDQVDHSSSSPW